MVCHMRYLLFVIRAVLTITLATSTLAGELPSIDPNHAQCFKKSRKKPNWAVCEELIPHVLERHRKGENVSGFISCVPKGIPITEVRTTFHTWISKRPHFSKYTAWDTLSGGLSVLYRCHK